MFHHRTLFYVILVIGLAIGHQDGRAQTVRKLAPGVLTVIPPEPLEQETFQGPLPLANVSKLDWTPNFTPKTDTLREKSSQVTLRHNVWNLELAFKPVLRTSVRPSEPLFEVHVGNQTFHATRGHPLWVSGNGWVKVGNLKSGMQVHALSGTMPVLSVDGEAAAAETFNLIVADFHTYFVGEDRLLSHDLSSQRPTRSVVPGLAGH